jgi:SAM-dependent methyltransferase
VSDKRSRPGFLEKLRDHELALIAPLIPHSARVLELGAGAGWQARALAAAGHSVAAIDIAGSTYMEERVWPVQVYDGQHIPYREEEFDVVFSSNVLEHICDVRDFQSEIRRVLKPGGLAIHVLPSASWRMWTNLTYYVHRLLTVKRTLARGNDRNPGLRRSEVSMRRYFQALFPSRHGEEGTFLSELFLFSRFRWRRLFASTGWTIVIDKPTGLFYTGYNVLGPAWGLQARRAASRVFGSACRIFVLTAVSDDDRK